MRQRIKVSQSLAGSSDLTRVKSAAAIRQLNHEQFMQSELFMAVSEMAKEKPVEIKEPSPNTMVNINVWGKDMKVPYKVAKSMGTNWWI